MKAGRSYHESRIVRRICVFCGSSSGARGSYATAATSLARHLVAKGIAIVYGGGKVGLMGKLADAALEAGGEIIGVIPRLSSKRKCRIRDCPI